MKLSAKLITSIIAILLIILIGVYLSVNQPKDQSDAAVKQTESFNLPTLEGIQKGNLLAHSYCSSCHMFPDPSLLSRIKWKNVFPQMGLRLGIKEYRGIIYTTAIKAPDLAIPSKPLLNNEQWQDIIDYYENTAPLRLPSQYRSIPIRTQLPYFSLISPSASFSGKQVLGTMVRIDSSVKPARIFVANGRSNKLFLLTNKLKVIDSISTGGPLVDILFDRGKIMICTIGKELGANSDKFGSVTELHISQSGKLSIDGRPVFSNLARPVQVLAADLNNDKRTDYIICEFGNINGELCWMENQGGGKFTKHIIRSIPGATKAYVDYTVNKGAPDLWVLFAQGQEGIYHFINKGDGNFVQKQVLRFPPIYGSSSFELVDMDHDGFKDIVYTCGDNGDATYALKPYHGVYIFINDKRGNYNKKYFYPINGCYKAFARDFDGDGNVDIATISLFTDPRQPEEGFVFLKNMGGLNFRPYALPQQTKFERAVTMDMGDINGDGKPDLLIGNAYFDFGPFKSKVKESLFFVLRNKTKFN